VTNQAREIDLVIDDALQKTGFAKLHLLGYSNGGHTVGTYLGASQSRRDKVASVIFLDSSGFERFAGMPERPEANQPTWPLGLINRADALSAFPPEAARCPGQQAEGIPGALWAEIRARDPIGANWGSPDGLSRFPIVSRFSWTKEVSSTIDLPALVLHGLLDTVVDPARALEIWSSSPLQANDSSAPLRCTSDAQCASGYTCRTYPRETEAFCRLNNRVFEPISCASHALLWETCSGDNCVDPHKRVQKRIGDWILTGK
jgi:pimeloyl-ACP methyl ester carboxylesterase